VLGVEHDDAELLRRGRAGDRDALRQLYERYHRRVLAVVVGMVRNPEDAREIVQDTFVRAFRSLDNFKGDSSFYTWLYRIAVNRAIDLQRRGSKFQSTEFDETIGLGDDAAVTSGSVATSEDPFLAVRNRELGRKISEAIEGLTPDHRAVILLREIEGLSYEEISEVMDCSLGTVMSRLHYARKKLQAKLKELL
jgi:RNA polymerase sigma-70 factor (ECF subfamily)